jgi:hypothetical protein
VRNNLNIPEDNQRGIFPIKFHANYSGFIEVDVEPKNPNLWVTVYYYSTPLGVNYDEERYLGAPQYYPIPPQYYTHYPNNPPQYYPIVFAPSEALELRPNGWVYFGVFNNSSETIVANVTVTYYY